MKSPKIYSILFWFGIVVLAVDLLSYLNMIMNYFTTLGVVLLFVSSILIVLGYILKRGN